MPDLARRRLCAELMDDPGLDPELHRAALVGLRRIHAVTGTPRVLWRQLMPLAREAAAQGRVLSVLDVACGSGDLLLALEGRARAHDAPIEFTGIDLSPTALALARARAARTRSAVQFVELDALRGELPAHDVVLSTFFLHHLGEADAIGLLGRMARAARRALVVHDLDRSRAGYGLAWIGTRLLTRSPIVHADGPTSVRNAFRPAEALELARRAGLEGARVRADLPCRWTLTWTRSPDL